MKMKLSPIVAILVVLTVLAGCNRREVVYVDRNFVDYRGYTQEQFDAGYWDEDDDPSFIASQKRKREAWMRKNPNYKYAKVDKAQRAKLQRQQAQMKQNAAKLKNQQAELKRQKDALKKKTPQKPHHKSKPKPSKSYSKKR